MIEKQRDQRIAPLPPCQLIPTHAGALDSPIPSRASPSMRRDVKKPASRSRQEAVPHAPMVKVGFFFFACFAVRRVWHDNPATTAMRQSPSRRHRPRKIASLTIAADANRRCLPSWSALHFRGLMLIEVETKAFQRVGAHKDACRLSSCVPPRRASSSMLRVRPASPFLDCGMRVRSGEMTAIRPASQKRTIPAQVDNRRPRRLAISLAA